MHRCRTGSAHPAPAHRYGQDRNYRDLRHINTFETSILPYEDCCTIFTPPHPKIRPELEEILAAEAAMPGLAALEAEAAEQTERIRVRITDQVEFEG